MCVYLSLSLYIYIYHNFNLGYIGVWEMLQLAEKTLGELYQRVDIPACARTADDGHLRKRLGEDFCLIVPHVPLVTPWIAQLT